MSVQETKLEDQFDGFLVRWYIDEGTEDEYVTQTREETVDDARDSARDLLDNETVDSVEIVRSYS